jgi:hypothetical protein
MSDPTRNASSPPARGGRNPIVAALMLIFGLILLLPGLCSIIFMGLAASDPRGLMNGGILGWLGTLWLVSFLISAGGIVLIRRVFR